MGWPVTFAEEDTGFVPAHATRPPKGLAALEGRDTTVFDPAGPGLVRLVLFADLDGDSLLSALPADTIRVATLVPDTAAVDSTVDAPSPEPPRMIEAMIDSILWRWEPYATAESLEVDPGLPTFVTLPRLPDTLAICTIAPPKPARARTDTLERAYPDTTGAAGADTLRTEGDTE